MQILGIIVTEKRDCFSTSARYKKSTGSLFGSGAWQTIRRFRSWDRNVVSIIDFPHSKPRKPQQKLYSLKVNRR
ncbi:hypothetical protein J6590_061902 [Homalodisca vitripennis]|nr:hypothetical protein J6590_061902 [Homalodisca vitripennis]